MRRGGHARICLALLIVLVVCAAIPPRAEAQGWSWIRRLSGPEYKKGVFGRFSVCLSEKDGGGYGITCGELVPLGRDLMAAAQPDRSFELQFGASVTYAWDGNNPDNGIADTSLWILEPELRLLILGWREGLVPLVSLGYGQHWFSGGTIPADFSNGAATISVGLRYPNPRADRWRLSTNVAVFVEGGVKWRRFTPALSNEDFGASSETREIDPWGTGLFVQLGFRWERR